MAHNLVVAHVRTGPEVHIREALHFRGWVVLVHIRGEGRRARAPGCPRQARGFPSQKIASGRSQAAAGPACIRTACDVLEEALACIGVREEALACNEEEALALYDAAVAGLARTAFASLVRIPPEAACASLARACIAQAVAGLARIAAAAAEHIAWSGAAFAAVEEAAAEAPFECIPPVAPNITTKETSARGENSHAQKHAALASVRADTLTTSQAFKYKRATWHRDKIEVLSQTKYTKPAASAAAEHIARSGAAFAAVEEASLPARHNHAQPCISSTLSAAQRRFLGHPLTECWLGQS